MQKKILSTFICTAITCLIIAKFAYSCNEHVCASIVSKCMLTESCKCDLKTCSCCNECLKCLAFLYTECCSCVEMCPKPNDTRRGLSKQSHVEDLDAIVGLFNALTEESDGDHQWLIFTFPVDFDAALYGSKPGHHIKMVMHSTDQSLEPMENIIKDIVTVNCTVVYMTQCMSLNKCRDHCQSMGATSFRWFHDGCCECVGSTCINYGINESKCLECPNDKSDEYEELTNEDELDYGEGMGPLDSGIDNNMN